MGLFPFHPPGGEFEHGKIMLLDVGSGVFFFPTPDMFLLVDLSSLIGCPIGFSGDSNHFWEHPQINMGLSMMFCSTPQIVLSTSY